LSCIILEKRKPLKAPCQNNFTENSGMYCGVILNKNNDMEKLDLKK